MKVIAPWLDIFGASSLALAAMVAGYFLQRIDHLVPETLLPVPVPAVRWSARRAKPPTDMSESNGRSIE